MEILEEDEQVEDSPGRCTVRDVVLVVRAFRYSGAPRPRPRPPLLLLLVVVVLLLLPFSLLLCGSLGIRGVADDDMLLLLVMLVVSPRALKIHFL